MSEMISVRFPEGLHAAVEHMAAQDKVTVSEFVRRVIDRETKNPQRARAVDFSEYPQTCTVASGGATKVVLTPSAGTSHVTENRAHKRGRGVWWRRS